MKERSSLFGENEQSFHIAKTTAAKMNLPPVAVAPFTSPLPIVPISRFLNSTFGGD
jgi:hypothetical protein